MAWKAEIISLQGGHFTKINIDCTLEMKLVISYTCRELKNVLKPLCTLLMR